jgi:hypothetical protein
LQLERGKKFIMRKSLLFLITLLMMVFIFAGTASAEIIDKSINLVIGSTQAQINGQSVTMSTPAQVTDGRTLVPLRFIGDAFGCDVQWDGDSRTATVVLADQIIEVPVGLNYAVINGDKTNIDIPAQIVNGSTMVPIRFISESLGSKVDYNAATQGITISLKTYINKDQGFEMILPADWVVDDETVEGVEISAYQSIFGLVGWADPAEGINASNFNEFAEECFKEYADKNEVSTFIEGVIAGVVYEEEGTINIHAYKLLDDGIYLCVFAVSKDLIDDNQAGQCDLIINSLKTSAIE